MNKGNKSREKKTLHHIQLKWTITQEASGSSTAPKIARRINQLESLRLFHVPTRATSGEAIRDVKQTSKAWNTRDDP